MGGSKVNAKRSADGKMLALQAVNPGNQAVEAQVVLEGFVPAKEVAQVAELAAPLEAVNTAEKPNAVIPRQSEWRHTAKNGDTRYVFPAHSLTVIRFE